MTTAQERTRQLLDSGIPGSLRELGDNSRKLLEIAKYWEDRFKENPSPEVHQQTQAYAAHSLQSISDHIFSLAGQFNEFLAAQSEQVESFQLEMQSVQTRIISNRQLAGARILKSFREDTGFIDIGNEVVDSGAIRLLPAPSFQLYNEGVLNFDAFNDVGVSLSDTTQIRLRSESIAQMSWKVPLGGVNSSYGSPPSLRRPSAAPGYEESISPSSLSRKASMASVYEETTSPTSSSRRPSVAPGYEDPSNYGRRPSLATGGAADLSYSTSGYPSSLGTSTYSSYQSPQSTHNPPPLMTSYSSGQLYPQSAPQSPPPPMMSSPQYAQPPPPMMSSSQYGQPPPPMMSSSQYAQPPPPMMSSSQYAQPPQSPPPPMMSSSQYAQPPPSMPIGQNLPPPPPMLGGAPPSALYYSYPNPGGHQ